MGEGEVSGTDWEERREGKLWLECKVKNLIKNCDMAIKANDKDKATELFNDMQTNIDHAVSKGLIKSNTAARQKSRLSNKLKGMK